MTEEGEDSPIYREVHIVSLFLSESSRDSFD
jgi:hypothetical protein